MNIENKAGRTPITIAYLNARKDVIRVLIENNAKLDIKLRFCDSIITLLETDEQKECFFLIRNALIKKLYDFVHNLSVEGLREATIDMLEPSESISNILEIDYYFAFKSIKKDDLSSYRDLIEDEEMKKVFAYFYTYEFKEKFIEDILNNLKDQIELINIGKAKLLGNITCYEVGNEISSVGSDIEINFKTLKNGIINDSLTDSIKLEEDKDLRELKILQLFKLMDKTVHKIQEKLNQAQDLYDSVNEAIEIVK